MQTPTRLRALSVSRRLLFFGLAPRRRRSPRAARSRFPVCRLQRRATSRRRRSRRSRALATAERMATAASSRTRRRCPVVPLALRFRSPTTSRYALPPPAYIALPRKLVAKHSPMDKRPGVSPAQGCPRGGRSRARVPFPRPHMALTAWPSWLLQMRLPASECAPVECAWGSVQSRIVDHRGQGSMHMRGNVRLLSDPTAASVNPLRSRFDPRGAPAGDVRRSFAQWAAADDASRVACCAVEGVQQALPSLLCRPRQRWRPLHRLNKTESSLTFLCCDGGERGMVCSTTNQKLLQKRLAQLVYRCCFAATSAQNERLGLHRAHHASALRHIPPSDRRRLDARQQVASPATLTIGQPARAMASSKCKEQGARSKEQGARSKQ